MGDGFSGPDGVGELVKPTGEEVATMLQDLSWDFVGA